MKTLRRICSRGVTVSVAAVVTAVRGNVLTARGLSELPDLGEVNAALARARRLLRKRASGRGRASLIDCPIRNLSRASGLANVFGRHHFFAIARAHAGAINSGAESGGHNGINPGVNVGLLLGEHAASLLLIEEDDGGAREAFAARGRGGDEGIRLSQSLRIGGSLQLRVHAAIKQNEKAEAGGLGRSAVSSPGIRGPTRRIVEPVSGEGKRLMKSFEIRVARVVVAIEAEVSRRTLLSGN